MKILIIGGEGMLGHCLFQHLRHNHETRATLRRHIESYSAYGLFDTACTYAPIDATDVVAVRQVIQDFAPEAIVNCVGIVKQLPAAHECIPSIEVNALVPHVLAAMARDVGARMVHLSTDCVFSGRKGCYTEADEPDPQDLYGRSKLLGEVADSGCITLRSSLIGHELARKTGLVEWFLSQRGSVKGFRNAVFSGFTTPEMARIIEMVLTQHPKLSGVWHVSSDPIDKFALLGLIKNYYALDIEIIPDDAVVCDRSLDSTRFREECRYAPPSWHEMIRDMRNQRINSGSSQK